MKNITQNELLEVSANRTSRIQNDIVRKNKLTELCHTTCENVDNIITLISDFEKKLYCFNIYGVLNSFKKIRYLSKKTIRSLSTLKDLHPNMNLDEYLIYKKYIINAFIPLINNMVVYYIETTIKHDNEIKEKCIHFLSSQGYRKDEIISKQTTDMERLNKLIQKIRFNLYHNIKYLGLHV